MATLAFGLLNAAPTIITGITSLVHAVEHLFGKGNGSSKKNAVKSAFQAAVQSYSAVAQAVPGSKLPQLDGAVEPAFDALVDAVVAFYNATGIFAHTGK